METTFNDRVGLVVWLYTTKYVNKLKRYGLVHYVSKNMNYAVIYIDKIEKAKISKVLEKQHFVREVESSINCDISYSFDGVLDTVTKLAEEKNKDHEESAMSLFTPFSEWSRS